MRIDCPHCNTRVLLTGDRCPSCRLAVDLEALQSRTLEEDAAEGMEGSRSHDAVDEPPDVVIPRAEPAAFWHSALSWICLAATRLVAGASLVLIGLGWIVLLTSLAVLSPLRSDALSWFWMLPAIPGVFAGIILVRGARRLRAKLISWTVHPALIQRPFVYLRSFRADGALSKGNPNDLANRITWGALDRVRPSVEEQMFKGAPLSHLVVVVGQPGEWLPPGGTARLYFKGDAWKQGVARILTRAELAILQIGDSPGVVTEARMLVRMMNPLRVLLFRPSGADEYQDEKLERLYETFRQQTASCFPKPLPECWRKWKPPFLLFDEEWKPEFLPDLVAGAHGNGSRLRQNLSFGDFKETFHYLLRRAKGLPLTGYSFAKTRRTSKRRLKTKLRCEED